jgi:hypothetical protein
MHVLARHVSGRQSVDRFSCLLLSDTQIVEVLEVEPKLGCRPEEMRESKRCVTRYGSSSIQNLSDTVGGDIELSRERGSDHAEFLQFLCQVLTGANCVNRHNLSPNSSQPSQRLLGG